MRVHPAGPGVISTRHLGDVIGRVQSTGNYPLTPVSLRRIAPLGKQKPGPPHAPADLDHLRADRAVCRVMPMRSFAHGINQLPRLEGLFEQLKDSQILDLLPDHTGA